MAKSKKTKTNYEQDSSYFLKLVLYLILGSLWLKLTVNETNQFPLPVGLIIGMIFAIHEHFRIDRKIEYALLLIATFVGFWLPVGIFIAL